MPNCPKCDQPLTEIKYPSNSPPNRDQWESQLAGDLFCACHNNNRGNKPYAYFWKHELRASVAPSRSAAPDAIPVNRSFEDTYRELVNRHDREHRWLNDAATEADCDLDQVANVIIRLKLEAAQTRASAAPPSEREAFDGRVEDFKECQAKIRRLTALHVADVQQFTERIIAQEQLLATKDAMLEGSIERIRNLRAQWDAARAAVPQAAAEPEELAKEFHATYERLAPFYGYRTRKESAKPWAEVPEQNRKLMIDVCASILERFPFRAAAVPQAQDSANCISPSEPIGAEGVLVGSSSAPLLKKNCHRPLSEHTHVCPNPHCLMCKTYFESVAGATAPPKEAE